MKPTKTSFAESSRSRAPLGAVAKLFLRIGASTWGSGNATIALLGDEMIERGWLAPSQFTLCFTLARVVPGTNVFAFCAATAWLVARWAGVMAALATVALPSAAVALTLTLAYERWHAHPAAAALISGAMAAIIGVIAAGAWLLLRPYLARPVDRVRAIVIACGAAALAIFLDMPPIRIMALAVVAGYFWHPRETA